ncbi:MAG TPA: DUF2975 domain-containing protein [Parvularculaceae bacterium]|nr:DUF2975 domain-containing protein [Parvularculaceae bacterium]HNS86305.1 DUF2975 domain-containing protein [Parvularculaceae bacterium]
MIRAIGKGSLASILAVGLHVVRVIAWIGFAGLSAALVAIPLIPPFAEWIAHLDGASIDGDIDIDAGDFVEVLRHFISFGVTLYVVERLLELLKTLRFGTPFVKENAVRFRRVGVALLFGEVSKIVIGILAMITGADVDAGLDFIVFVSIAAVFVLAEVFHEGARMKEEQDLTV